uniref:Uncharacterized protein n=1 Tax=Trichogramma kaykai TaxID=54128 RepID=A0ABD2WJX3_9HYME
MEFFDPDDYPSDNDYFYEKYPTAFDGDSYFKSQRKLEVLKDMRKKINWEIEEERNELLDRLYPFISDWDGRFIDLRDVFRTEEIDWLLTKDVKNDNGSCDPFRMGDPIIKFVIDTGYKDEPKLDEVGKPQLRRTTAVHHAARLGHFYIVDSLFKIYNRFDVNYTDESGWTHFHAACVSGCHSVVEKFLKLGQDPNCIVTKTGDSPLHLALAGGHKYVARSLLRHGADPNSVDERGSTPLHAICKRDDDGASLAKMFFEINEEKNQLVRVDAEDKLGRTPLQWAAASLLPDAVEILLNRGADLSSFVFPDVTYFGEGFEAANSRIDLKLKLASGAVAVVDRLEKRGYRLDRSDVLTIMRLFAKSGLFERSKDLGKFWHNDKQFTSGARKIMIDSGLSLYDLIETPIEEAKKPLDFAPHWWSEHLHDYWMLPEWSRKACVAHLCEIITRRLCRRWTLEFFSELTQRRLTILCCEKIIGQLTNEDMLRICLAAEIVTNERPRNI